MKLFFLFSCESLGSWAGVAAALHGVPGHPLVAAGSQREKGQTEDSSLEGFVQWRG